MLNLRDDGTITIDFAEPTGTVTIAPPKYGAYKRLRRERQRLSDELMDAVAALPDLGVVPPEDDQSDEAKAERLRLTPLLRERLHDVEEMAADMLAKTWRLILIGDETFAGFATPKPPDDPDEWPTEILVDAGAAEIAVVNGRRVRTNEAVIDRVFLHLSRAHFHSSSTAP